MSYCGHLFCWEHLHEVRFYLFPSENLADPPRSGSSFAPTPLAALSARRRALQTE